MFPGKKSRKSHVSRQSQETQSPVTKLFRTSVKSTDSSCGDERENLLKQKKKTKKGQQHIPTPKVSCECTPPITLMKEKLDRKGSLNKIECEDTTFSCTSCVLKKLITNNPSKLILILVAVAAFIIFTVFILNEMTSCTRSDSKNDFIFDEEIRDRRSDNSMDHDRKPWDPSKSKLKTEFSELMGPGYMDASINDMNLDQFGNSMPELSSILDPAKVNQPYSSNSLRNFYKKLVRTDLQIKNLKKGFAALKRSNSKNFIDPNPPRKKRSIEVSTDTTRARLETTSRLNKRSLKSFNFYPPVNSLKEIDDIEIDIKTNVDALPDPDSSTQKSKERKLPHHHASTHKNKVQAAKYTQNLMDYKTPSYQDEMKQYNKNSEKLDELLGLLLHDKHAKIRFNIEYITKGNETNEVIPSTSSKNPMETSKQENTNKLQRTTTPKHQRKTKEGSTDLVKLNTRYDKYDGRDANMDMLNTKANSPDLASDNESTTENYEYLITVSSILVPPLMKHRNDPMHRRALFPKLRRLLQHTKNYDEDDDDDAEAEDYEDLSKEPWEREKRTTPMDLELKKIPETFSTTQIPEIRNTNGKGSMTYHNELNYMIDAAMKMVNDKSAQNLSKEKISKSQKNSFEYDENDANDKYNGLVEMAQAYSDYGVLDGTKVAEEKNKVPVNSMSQSGKLNHILEQMKNKYDKSRQMLNHTLKIKTNRTKKAHVTNKLFKKLGLLTGYSRDKLVKNKGDHKDVLNIQSTPSSYITDENTKHDTYLAEMETARDIADAYPKGLRNHKERSFASGFRRSLKSIDTYQSYDDADISEVEYEVQEKHNSSTDSLSKTSSNSTVWENKSKPITSNISNMTDQDHASNVTYFKEIIPRLNNDSTIYNNSKTPLSLGNIFGMITDFCLFLSGFDTEQEKNNFRSAHDFIAVLNPSAAQNNSKATANILNNDTRTQTTATFDSEKVENIGHRSRVLLSFEEQTENVTSSYTEETSEPYDIANTEQLDMSLKNKTKKTVDNANQLIETDNVTVVKRSADSNLLTWNDLYDDEYGVKDKLDNDMKEKSSDKYNEFLAKSENWLGTKIKLFANSVKNKSKIWKARKNATRNTHNIEDSRPKMKRSIPKEDSGKKTFEALTANMKKVFHEAASAIQNTVERDVRSNSEQASNMMQQLVELMSELVNVQVKQKTCIQLPDDLRSFLAWLTSPEPQEPNNPQVDPTYSYDTGSTTNSYGNIEPYELLSPNTRNECLGTIHDVEDLIQLYDEMSEEDKSKMLGVREYLEHQLDFLHRQLSNFNEFGFPVMYQGHVIRRRRQLQNEVKHKRRQRTANKFIKYFGRKRTKFTISDEATEDYSIVQRKSEKAKNYRKHDKNKNKDKVSLGKTEPQNSNSAIIDKDVNKNDKTVNKRTEEDPKKINLLDAIYSPLVTNNATTVKFNS